MEKDGDGDRTETQMGQFINLLSMLNPIGHLQTEFHNGQELIF